MDKIFSSRPGRTKFLWTVFALLSFLLIIRFGVFPNSHFSSGINETVISFIEKFVASIFTAVMVGLFLYWIQGNERKMEVTFTSSGSEVETALSQARMNTKFWCFSGGLGRYTRSTTMPELSRIAKDSNGTIALKLVVLNPFNDKLLQEYCDFRLTFEESGISEKWHIEETQAEIFATIIQGTILGHHNRLLDIKIATKNYFTLSRMDISSSVTIITRENPKIPSQVAESDSHLYKHYTEEFNHIFRHSTELDIRIPQPLTLSCQHICTFLEKLFPDSIKISEGLAKKIIIKINNPKKHF